MLSFGIVVDVCGDLEDRSEVGRNEEISIILRAVCVSLNVIHLVADHSVLRRSLL